MDSTTIYWDPMCGNDTIYHAFWDYNLTIDTTNPDLTNCFQDTVLIWIPTAVLIISSFLFLLCYSSYTPESNYGSITRLVWVKLVVCVLLAMFTLGDLTFLLVAPYSEIQQTIYLAQILAPVLLICDYIVAIVVQVWAVRKGIYSPAVLFIFWLLLFIVDILILRSNIIQLEIIGLTFPFITFIIEFTMVTIIFICNMIPDYGANPIPWKRLISEETPLLDGQLQTRRPSRTSTDKDEGEDQCPKVGATFLSVLFFGWFTQTVITGYKRALQWHDIWRIRKEDSSYDIVPRFEREWKKELEKCKRLKDTNPDWKAQASLTMALVRTFGGYYSMAGALLVIYNAAVLINPQLLRLIINFVETGEGYTWHGIVLAITMFLSSVFAVLGLHHSFNMSYTTGMRIRTALTTAIYRKSLKLSPTAKKFTTVGEIVNLMSVDTQKLQDIPQFLHFVWMAPVIVSLTMYFLYQILGPSCFVSLAYLFVIVPFNSILMAKITRKYQKKQMIIKDQRLKLMNQVLSGVKVLKLYAWEKHFEKKILELRDQELHCMKRIQLFGAFTFMMFFCTPFIVALLSFTTYVLVDPTNVLDATTAFVSLSLINLINLPMGMLPTAVMYSAMAVVSLKRIGDFLQSEEIDENNVQNDIRVDATVQIENGTFSWGEEERTTLRNINMQVSRAKLIAVVGKVGSGKSSLLTSILGEMKKHSGSVNVVGSVAYVPQQAWIQNLTLKDNILFARPMNEQYYQQVLSACALNPDLEILPGGDMTEIGERGINLSGGQKQRVSLARAVYQDADIYLLDDTLSAVDAHVGKHIFENILGPSGLLQHKTRIFVTNQVHYLKHMDEIFVMKDGVVSESGSFETLMQKDGAFAEFIRTYTPSSDSEDKAEIEKLHRQLSEKSGADQARFSGSESKSRTSSKRKRKSTIKSEDVRSQDKSLKKEKMRKNIIIEESVEEGAVKLSVIKYYLMAARFIFSIVALLTFIVFITAQVLTSLWLSEWSGDQPVNGTMDRALLDLRLGVYGGLGACQTFGMYGLAFGIAFGAISASKKLHSTLLYNIMKCPMSFFDTTPLGRIVNRFSKDIDIIDANLPQYAQMFITGLAPLFASIIIIVYTFPIFMAVIVPLLIFFALMQRVYVACARQLKRLDSIKRSPLYAFFHETLNGVSSVRAYKQQQRFTDHSDKLLDNNQRVWFEVFTSNRWAGVYSELVGDLVVLFTALFAVLSSDTTDPGLVGLSLNYALGVSGALIMCLRSSCELETYIVAVERIKEYSEAQTEAAYILPENRPTRSWPENGVVEFKDYCTKYRSELELVLRGVSCKIQSGQRVGIVGRTGAGKSSMTLSLFRLIEATGGSIVIDGIDISSIGLHDLRSKLTIIPQDPVMFSGSLRFNVDPAEMFSDAEIWEALRHAHLSGFVQGLPDQLDYECGEEGQNLSVGQRQLLCLGRALLRHSKILVLDEATASIDMETDDLIQETIRSEFKQCTVITIAHRLNTIMDYDSVIVMDGGRIVEQDNPNDLLDKSDSVFYGMAKDAGIVSNGKFS